MEGVLKDIHQGILKGDLELVKTSVQAGLDEKLSAEAILKQGMMTAMAEVGQLFEDGEYFVPELLVAARAMQGGLEILKPVLATENVISSLITTNCSHEISDSTDITMNKIIISIHGLGNKPPRDVLEDWWLQSIQEGLTRIGKKWEHIPFELVYWADITHPTPLDITCTNPDDPLYVENPYVKGPLEVVAKKPSLKTKLFNYIDEQLDRVFLNDDLSINFKHVTDRIIHRYFADLETYFSDNCTSLSDPACSAKTDIQNRLLQVLQKYEDYDILLIAHSMGSIVAFDVLTTFADQLNINTFVTIGSPLGLPVIMGRIFAEQRKVRPHIKKPQTPDCIWPNWYNLSDREDKVAMDQTLNDDYAPNRLGTSAVDMTVYNDYEINGERNAHKSYGYLRTREMAWIINAFLARTKTGDIFNQYRKFTKIVIAELKEIRDKLFKRGDT